MRRFICAISLLLCACVILCACGGTENGAASQATEELSTDTTTTTSGGDSMQAWIDQLTLNGTDISKYVILYPRSDYYQAGKAVLKRISQEYQYDLLTAERVAKLIYDACGVEVQVKLDTAVEESDYEILIGSTNRTQSNKAVSRLDSQDDYIVQMVSGKLVICGGTYGTTWHAVDALEEHLKKSSGQCDISDDFSVKSAYHLTTICCIGDSITYGSQSTDPVYLSYPANLQRLLWKECVIYNYGKGGRTLRNDLKDQNGDNPAWTITAEYKNCMANPTKYDYVLIMLGTNDSDRAAKYGCIGGYKWNEQDDEKYISDYMALVDQLKAKNAESVFVVMNCPACYRSTSYDSARVRTVQATVAQKLKDRGDDVYLYDMNTYTAKNLGSENFPDELHPSDEGYALMADGVAAMLDAIWNGKQNEYILPLE